MDSWIGLNSWFNFLDQTHSKILSDSEISERFLKSGMKAGDEKSAFENALRIGLEGHSTRAAFQKVSSAMDRIGFTSVHISGDDKKGYKISFLPSSEELRNAIKPENIPSIEIMPGGDMGMTIMNNLPAMDA